MNQRLRILFSTESADPWILDAYKSFFDAFKSNHEVEIFCTTDGSKRDIDILPAYNIIDYSYLTKAGVPELVQRMITHIDPKLVEKAAAACSWSTPETIVRRLLFFKAVVGLIKPDIVIVWNGMSDIRLVVREFLEEVGIPFVYAEKGMLPNSWYIDPSGINARCSLTPDCTEQKTAATNQKDLLEYVNSIVSTGASAWEQPKRHGRSEFLQSLNILPQSKIIFFPGQVEKDSNIVHFSPLKSMVEAVKAIIDAMPAETVLLVKPHPKSSSESQSGVADLAATYPNVVIVKDVNVWDIIEAADVVVSINSTVAFESLLQQKNVVLLGEGVLSKTGLVPQTPVGELKNVLSSYLKSDCAKNANFERSLALTDFLRQKYYMFKGETRISPFAYSLLSKYTRQSVVYPFTRNELFISLYGVEAAAKMIPSKKTLSVVLTACNRPQMLGQVLDGFAIQTAKRNEFEVIVVDDGSQPPVKALVESFSQKFNVRYIYQENSGLAVARNTGIKAVRGEIVLFHDDDDLPHPDLIAEHIESHRQYPDENVAVLGHLDWHSRLKVTPLMKYITGQGGQYFSYTRMKHSQFYDAWKWWGGLISAKTSLLQKLDGPFDPVFRFGCEDTELVCRLLNRNFKILYNANAISYIVKPMEFEEFCKRRVKQGRALYHCAQRHPEIISARYKLKEAQQEFQYRYAPILKKYFALASKYEQMLASDPNAFTGSNEPLMKSSLQMWSECFQGYFHKGYLEEMIASRAGESMMSKPVDLDKEVQICKPHESEKKFLDSKSALFRGNNKVAAEYFQKAQREIVQGNFLSAIAYGRQYRNLIDYDSIERVVDHDQADNIDISVVIVTYKRSDEVRKAMESLRRQNAPGCNFEVIIVDNGQGNPAEYKGLFEQYICCPTNFKPSEGRNIGVHFAHGKIIVFVDDDAIVGKDYLASIKMAFDKLDIFGLRGRAYPKSDPDANKGVSIYNLGDSPFPSYCNQEGNSAFRRDIYLEMGGMDPLLFGHEGCDLTYRIIKAYKQPNKVIYWPWTIIYHDFGSSEKAAEKKKLHQLSSDYLKFKHNADIFVNRKEIERCPLPIKQTFVPHAQNHPAPKSPATSAIAAGSIKPKVSIVIACHNSRQFLPQCLDSIKNQTMTEWELLLLDDASTDGTRDIIENYSRMDARIKPFYFNDKQGPYVRRNFAIERAACDFIIIQDSDDIMHPSKCQRLYEEIIKDNQLGVVGSFYRLFLDEFKGLEYTEGVELPLIHEQIMEKYKTHLYICWHASAIIRKSMFDAIGLYDENPYGSDKLWLAKAAEYVRYTGEITFANIPEYLTLKREHASSQQGVLPPIDPRSRRAMFQAYWVDKLAKIREKFQKTPGLDIKAELKNCKCNDYIQRFCCLFEKWESQPLDENMLYKFVSKGIIEFKEARHVTCLITLDGVEKILSTVAERFKNYDLLRGMASFVLDRKVKSIEYLNREIRNHNSPAAKQFIADFFENHSKTDVRRWCTENDSRYDLQIIDLGKAGDRQQAQIPVAEKQPLVSVIMPAYNAAEYIAKAIESALNQTYRNFELIIINDGSTDQTENIILGFNDKRIKYSRQENRGLAATHNTGIRKSAGEFVIKLDVDDMMTPDFIAKHIMEFEKHSEADLVYCDDLLIDENDQPIRVINRPEYMDAKLLIRDLFRCGFPVVPFRTCIRKNVFDKIGYFDETLRVAEDYDMMRRFVKHGLRVHHLPAALYLRRIAADSLSRKFSAEKAKSHFDVVKRYSDTFACEELFPDVDWSKVSPEKRKLQTKCLSAVTCFTIGQSYVKTAPVYAKTAFDQAYSELDECFGMDPANPHVQQLLRKCQAVRTQCEQAVQEAVY